MLFAIGGILVLIAGIGAYVMKAAEGKKMPSIIRAAIMIAAILVGVGCVATVPTGHTGIVTTFGRVENYTLEAGVHFVAPWQNVVKMDNRVQKASVELYCFSSDIQEVSMAYTINYQINKANAMDIYRTMGKDYYSNIVVPVISETVKTEVAKYTAEQLIGQRSELAMGIERSLTDILAVSNVEVVSTAIEDMDFTDAFTNAVEDKQVAQQNKLKAETEAEQRIIEAEAQAEIQKVEADAYAYETTTKAEAEAEANRKIAESLTKDLIDYTYAQTWDGKYPTIYGADNVLPMVDIP